MPTRSLGSDEPRGNAPSVQLETYADADYRLRALLLNCLEEHYGSLEGCVVNPDRAVEVLRNIQAELDRVKDLL